MKKLNAQLTKLKNTVYNLGFLLQKEEIEEFLNMNDKRIILTFNIGVKHQGALMPNGNKQWFITINKTLMKKLKLKENDFIDFVIESDPSEYGMPFPEEFEIALEQVSNANHFFMQQTMGNKRNLIRVINNYKSSDKRIEKSLIIAQYLVDVQGKIEGKSLLKALSN